MSRTNIFIIMCTYKTKDGDIDIPLYKELERQFIEPVLMDYGVEYDLRSIVEHNSKIGIPVRYVIKTIYIDEDEVIGYLTLFGCSKAYSALTNTHWWLNSLQEEIFKKSGPRVSVHLEKKKPKRIMDDVIKFIKEIL